MVIREIKQQAAKQLAQAPVSPRLVALVYASVALGVPLVAQVVLSLLDLQIADTEGLAGIGTRSVFMSLQLLLTGMITVLTPFWSYGYMGVALQTAKGLPTRPDKLLSGFRRFWPLLRLSILLIALYFFLGSACMYAGSLLYMLTPHSAAVIEQMDQIMLTLESTVPNEELLMNLAASMWPAYLLIGILLTVVLVPISYRLRLAEWTIMDGNNRALFAMAVSNFSMRGRCFRMFLLDLSFWWYYLLSALFISLGDMGRLIPGGGELAFWGFYLLGVILQFGLLVLFMPKVQTTYAIAYTTLLKDPMGDRKPPEQE